MRSKSFFALAAAFTLLLTASSSAQTTTSDALVSELAGPEDLGRAIEGGSLNLNKARRMGLEIFTGRFTKKDGLGDGPFDIDEWLENPLALGHRATLQGNGQLLRLNGLDAQSCNECHSIVSHRTNPPRLGIGGVGGMVQNAVILPSLIDVADSGDDRVSFVPGHEPDLPLEVTASPTSTAASPTRRSSSVVAASSYWPRR